MTEKRLMVIEDRWQEAAGNGGRWADEMIAEIRSLWDRLRVSEDRERAEIVAWLRSQRDSYDDHGFLDIADDIEAKRYKKQQP